MTGLVTENGEVLSFESFPTITGTNGGHRSAEQILAELKTQCNTAGYDWTSVEGIGIVSAGPLDPVTGVIENPYTLPGWDGYSIADDLSDMSGCICKLDNDANGMLLGEVLSRDLFGKNVLMLSFGTGIGVASYQKDHIYRANGRFHPEMGHVIVADNGPECYCGHKGCFESLCSGTNLHRFAVSEGYIDFNDLYQSWKSKHDPKATRLMETVRHRITSGVFSLMVVFKPDELVIGGGFGRGYFNFLKDIIEEDLHGIDDFLVPFSVSCAAENGVSALIGAAGLLRI